MESVKILLRLPSDIAAGVGRAAVEARRSRNAEIVARLEASLVAGGADIKNAAEIAARPDISLGSEVREPSAVEWPGLGSAPVAKTPADTGKSSSRSRTSMCEHRVPASAHCKVCDG